MVRLTILILLFSLTVATTKRNSNGNDSRRTTSSSTNPYHILGVTSSASLEDIKHNYRTLAKEHHPDKGGNPDTFAKIANAYEILSDTEQRRRFDQQQFRGSGQQQPKPKTQKQQDAQRRAEQFQRQKQQTQQREAKQQRLERVKYARLMQRHVLRLHTVEDLFEYGILNKDMTFQKNFVAVFVGNKKEDAIVDDEFLFPFPFWGKTPNGMVWQDVLQTAKVRYNKVTELTDLFDVPQGTRRIPHVVFVGAGQSIDNIQVFSAQRQSELQGQLEHWITNCLTVKINIINRHHAAIKLFLVSDQTQQTKIRHAPIQMLDPGQATPLVLHIGDKVLAVDARVDAYPGSSNFDPSFFKGSSSDFGTSSPNPESWYFQNPAILGEYLIGLETTLYVEEEHCFDLSLKCQSWVVQSGSRKLSQNSICQDQAEFMHHICPATCAICHRKNKAWLEKVRYPFQHAPLYQWPHWIRPVVKFARFASEDMYHVLVSRQSIATMFLVMGAALGANLFLIPTSLLGGGVAGNPSPSQRLTWHDVTILGIMGCTFLFWTWLHFGTLASKSSLRRDWDHILEWQLDALFGLIGWGIVVTLVVKTMVVAFWRRLNSISLTAKLVFSSLILTLFAVLTTGMVLVTIDMDPTKSRRRRWQHMWRLRRNVAAALIFTGMSIGMSIPPLWKGMGRCPALFFVVVLDVVTVMALDWLSLSEIHFVDDLNHVLQMRMSGAIPIAVFGVFLGFGVPLGVSEFMPMQPTKNTSVCSTKTKVQ